MRTIKLLIAATILGFTSLLFAAVNINTATVEELASLDGIGQVKAAAIVEHREAEGDFKSVDDITKVPQIGDATLEKNRDNLTVGGDK